MLLQRSFAMEPPLALQQLFGEDDSLLLRGLAEWDRVRVSSSAREVVGVHRRLVGQLPRGENITGLLLATAVDAVAVKAVKGPTQRKHDRTL